jgi:hypothetical protein
VTGRILCDVWHSYIWSVESLRQVWSLWLLQQWWQPSSFLTVTCCGVAFPGIGVQGVRGLILVGTLFPLDGGGEEKERKKKSPWGRKVSPRLDPPCWLCSGLQLLGAIKG